MKKFLKHIVTGVDNDTADVGRISLLLGIISYICFSYISLSKSGTFDPTAYGVGFGSICAGAGALLKLKEGTEPNGNTSNNKQDS